MDAYLFFFFQAEDGIRDGHVTGVQTCALPIYRDKIYEDSIIQLVQEYQVGGLLFFQGSPVRQANFTNRLQKISKVPAMEIGRASCRERGESSVVAGSAK